MIVINFAPGALGFLALKTVHAHWPTHFCYYDNPYDKTHNNHSVQPNLFLSNQSGITADQAKFLNQLSSKPSIVLVHNANLIPDSVINNAKVFTINCDTPAFHQANFLYWFKNTKSIFGWICRHAQVDLCQSAYLELVRIYQQPATVELGTQIDFWDLAHADSLIPVLDAVKDQYELGSYNLKHDWYADNYARSVLSILHANSKIYNYFVETLHILDQTPGELLSCNYQSILSVKEQEKFRTIVDFFHGMYRQQAT